MLKLIRNTPKGFTQLDEGVCFSDLFDLNQMQFLDESAQSDSPGEVSLVKMVEAFIQPAMRGAAGPSMSSAAGIRTTAGRLGATRCT